MMQLLLRPWHGRIRAHAVLLHHLQHHASRLASAARRHASHVRIHGDRCDGRRGVARIERSKSSWWIRRTDKVEDSFVPSEKVQADADENLHKAEKRQQEEKRAARRVCCVNPQSWYQGLCSSASTFCGRVPFVRSGPEKLRSF